MPEKLPCPNCGKLIPATSKKCVFCGKTIFSFNMSNQERELILDEVDNESDKILITSTNSFETNRITEYKGHISTEVCMPDGIFGFVTHGTFFTVEALSKAKWLVTNKLAKIAIIKGANAIVGFDIDISALLGGVVVSANGTAVVVENFYQPKISQGVSDINNYMEQERMRQISNYQSLSKPDYRSQVSRSGNDSINNNDSKKTWQCPKCKRENSINNTYCYFCNTLSPFPIN